MKRVLIIICFSGGLLLAQCKTAQAPMAKAPEKTVAPAVTTATPPPPVNDVAVGEMLYKTKCDDCHKLPRVNEYSANEWASIMVKMGRKAHLSQTETVQVLTFINTSTK